MIIKREFQLFEDESTGAYGLAINKSQYHEFNAFWNGIGIFHDCMEHWFEGDRNTPFKGNKAYTIWGEVAALGAATYYSSMVYNRYQNTYWSGQDAMFAEVYTLINEEEVGGNNFPLGDCPVGYIRPNEIDYLWIDTASNRSGYKVSLNNKDRYKDVRNTMRWGCRMAEKMYFNGMHNVIEELERFTKSLSPEYLYDIGITGIDFFFYVKHKQLEQIKLQLKGNWYLLQELRLQRRTSLDTVIYKLSL